MSKMPNPKIEKPLNPRPTAVVVGASSGIGAALAHLLGRKGYRLALLSRRKDLLNQLCEQINQAAGEAVAFAYPHDVTEFDQVPPLFQQILKDFQQIDLFIYNSGVMYSLGQSEYDFQKDLETYRVNLLGGVAWLNQAASLFHSQRRGQIVGIGSIAGDRGRVGNPPYHAAKAGFATYLESLRNRLAPDGVHVLTVKPGYVQTDLLPAEHPPLPVATPEKTAESIFRAIRRRKQVLYTPGWWRLILLIVIHMPSFIFRRMKF